jgi:hypothetical protein
MAKRWNGKKMSHGKLNLARPSKTYRSADTLKGKAGKKKTKGV